MDPRVWIYAGLDFLSAAAFTWVVATMLPNRDKSATLHLWSLVGLLWVMGFATLTAPLGRWLNKPALARWGRRVAIAGAILLLLFGVVVLMIRILVSVAFLAGVYGAMGKAAGSFAVVAALLIIEVVGLLPAFQLNFLMRRIGKRAFSPGPGAKA